MPKIELEMESVEMTVKRVIEQNWESGICMLTIVNRPWMEARPWVNPTKISPAPWKQNAAVETHITSCSTTKGSVSIPNRALTSVQ